MALVSQEGCQDNSMRYICGEAFINSQDIDRLLVRLCFILPEILSGDELHAEGRSCSCYAGNQARNL